MRYGPWHLCVQTEAFPQKHVGLYWSAARSCPALCNPMDCSSISLLCPRDFPGKKTGVGCHLLPRGSSRPRDSTWFPVSPTLAGGFFTTEPPGKPMVLGTGWYFGERCLHGGFLASGGRGDRAREAFPRFLWPGLHRGQSSAGGN